MSDTSPPSDDGPAPDSASAHAAPSPQANPHDPGAPVDDDPTRMTLGEHLNELRGCLLRSGLVFLALFILAMVFQDTIGRFMQVPWERTRASLMESGSPDPGRLAFISPAEGVLFSLKAAMAVALLVGGPFFLWEVWRFVGAGLTVPERSAVRRIFPAAVALFLGGLAFAWGVMVPFGLPFLLSWLGDLAVANITLAEYWGFLTTLGLVLGLIFELPVIMWLVVRAGFIDAAILSSSRRVAILVLLVLAALLTPPDPLTQVLVAGPAILLYEIGLLLARRAEAARERALL
ncbi:MAG: Sec-independent protein translocase protein TatC [Planctomycetota bacterium]|nr:MAG: Sec-independent protein translocase protein TatC [Planctomycetota bacterium]